MTGEDARCSLQPVTDDKGEANAAGHHFSDIVQMENQNLHHSAASSLQLQPEPLSVFPPPFYEGAIFQEEDAMKLIEFYEIQSQNEGWTIRKVRHGHNVAGTLNRLHYCCNKEGKASGRSNDAIGDVKKRMKQSSRTGCKAHLLLLRNEHGLWFAKRYDNNHNHEFMTQAMMRQYVKTRTKAIQNNPALIQRIKDLARNGNHAAPIFKILQREYDGNLPITTKDLNNFIGKNVGNFSGKDDAAFTDYLQRKKEENHRFTYNIRTDEDGRLTSAFWIDAEAIELWQVYGDVVIFDATYQMNRYDLPFCPFVGIDNNGLTILFGCALIQKETSDIFCWIFSSWKKAVCVGTRTHPDVIMTDQDKSIADAIKSTLPETKHALCTWHIAHKFLEKISPKVGNRFREFYSDFWSIIYKCLDIDRIEILWHDFLEKFGLIDDTHLAGLWAIREQWMQCYCRSFFMAGSITTHRSVSINSFFDEFFTTSTSLLMFAKKYEGAVKSRKDARIMAELKAKNKVKLSFSNPIKQHASELYSAYAMSLFFEEVEQSHGYDYELIEGTVGIIKTLIRHTSKKDGGKIVVFDYSDEKNLHLKCDCLDFSFKGIMCRHMLRVLSHHNIHKIPDDYVLNRWLEKSKMAHLGDKYAEVMQSASRTTSVMRNQFNYLFQILCDQEITNIENGIATSDELKATLVSAIESSRARAEYFLREKHGEIACKAISTPNATPTSIKDPERSQTNGRQQHNMIQSDVECSIARKQCRCGDCEDLGHRRCNINISKRPRVSTDNYYDNVNETHDIVDLDKQQFF